MGNGRPLIDHLHREGIGESRQGRPWLGGYKRRPAVPPAHLIPERTFTANVIKLAQVLGWRCAHFRPGMTQRGKWVTAMSGSVGFPDLVLVRARDHRLIFAELKSHTGKLSPEQVQWMAALGAVTFAEKYVWRPADWNLIEGKLR